MLLLLVGGGGDVPLDLRTTRICTELGRILREPGANDRVWMPRAPAANLELRWSLLRRRPRIPAMRSYLQDFSDDEGDILREAKAIIAKVAHASGGCGSAAQASSCRLRAMADVRPIEIHEHDPAWGGRFAALRGDVLDVSARVGARVDVHHIGSTSVPGLAAKPIVDLLVVAASLDEAHALAIELDAGQWQYQAGHEQFLPARRFCNLDDPYGVRLANLHAFVAGDPAIERHLAFPAQLRHHDAARDAYERRKRELAAEFVDDVHAYSMAKTELVREIEAAGLPRAIEGSATCAAGAPGSALDPGWLAPWWFSHVDPHPEGVALTMEEEYGYRRTVIAGPPVVSPEEESMVLDVLRLERTWDDAPGGPATQVEVAAVAGSRIDVVVVAGTCTVRWSGLDPAAHDVTRREGAALLHALQTLALAEGADGDDGTATRVLERDLPVGPGEAWAELLDPVGSTEVLGSWDAWLRDDPGRAWNLGTVDGVVHGRVLVAVAGRRLVLSWRGPRDHGAPPLLVDLVLARTEGGSACRAQATISGARPGTDPAALEHAAGLVAGWLDRLAARTEARAAP